ncbi:8-oxoguanine DNA-glycosylase [Teladorsagia circumcincta]|uniref:8-oxoguanine DNA-glycosylase n=1 Tax=Teladorsagia circumcincta TaxID=45464 RepID=A0A2G9UHS4_TELCI|nr:8-oxoguanine DNA-glycosylase [Teladorsagia circumcincta]
MTFCLFWCVMLFAGIIACAIIRKQIRIGLRHCVQSANKILMKNNVIAGVEDKGQLSCHKVVIHMMWFRFEDCLPDIERLIRIEASGGAVVFGTGAHTAPAKEMTRKEIAEKARHLILKYSQEFVKDTARTSPLTRLVMPILKISSVELNLKAVLLNGQSFRWRSIGDSFYGVVDGFLLRLRRVDEENIEWSRLGSAANVTEVDIPGKLHDYFQLDICLEKLWDYWSAQDSLMAELRNVKELQGIRVLSQDPLETLLAFICSANNNIPRISMQKDQLEKVLREQLFGYRAKSISGTVTQLSEMPSSCLVELQYLPTDEIRKFLLNFAGVGPKITKKYYLPSLKDSTLTNTLSRRLMEFYEDKFGTYAGWAQAVLFNQQLEKFVRAPSKETIVKVADNGKISKNVAVKSKREAAVVSEAEVA